MSFAWVATGVDAQPTRHVVRALKTLAENIGRHLAKEDRVFVHGTVTTEAWTDKQTGEKQTVQRVSAEIVAPSLRWASRRVIKTTRTVASGDTPHDVNEQQTSPSSWEGARRDPLRAPSHVPAPI
jgi:single-stranded DNA-binding protein